MRYARVLAGSMPSNHRFLRLASSELVSEWPSSWKLTMVHHAPLVGLGLGLELELPVRLGLELLLHQWTTTCHWLWYDRRRQTPTQCWQGCHNQQQGLCCPPIRCQERRPLERRHPPLHLATPSNIPPLDHRLCWQQHSAMSSRLPLRNLRRQRRQAMLRIWRLHHRSTPLRGASLRQGQGASQEWRNHRRHRLVLG